MRGWTQLLRHSIDTWEWCHHAGGVSHPPSPSPTHFHYLSLTHLSRRVCGGVCGVCSDRWSWFMVHGWQPERMISSAVGALLVNRLLSSDNTLVTKPLGLASARTSAAMNPTSFHCQKIAFSIFTVLRWLLRICRLPICSPLKHGRVTVERYNRWWDNREKLNSLPRNTTLYNHDEPTLFHHTNEPAFA